MEAWTHSIGAKEPRFLKCSGAQKEKEKRVGVGGIEKREREREGGGERVKKNERT